MATAIVEFAAEILAGDHDSNLDTLAAAITKRLVDGHASERWRIDIPADVAGLDDSGLVVTEDDLTMSEARGVEFRTGKSWVHIDPRGSADDALAVATVRLITLGVEDAEERMGAVAMNTFVEWLSLFTVTPDPKDSAA